MPQLLHSPERTDAGTLGMMGTRRTAAAVGAGLCSNELRRRLWHILPGLLPFLAWVVPHEDPVTVWFKVLIVGDTALLMFAAIYWSRTFLRPGEGMGLGSILGYAAVVPAMLVLFPGQIELGLTVLAIIAFGDGIATLAGLHWGGPSLPWNAAKTWIGSIAFVATAVPMATIVYYGEARPSVPFATALLCGSSAAVVAAIAESMPSRINDNIRVGVAAAAVITLMQSLVVGWP